MVTPGGVSEFLGSIVACCARPSPCGLDSGGKPLIRDQAMEALLCLFLVGGIVSESPAAKGLVMMVVAGQLCEVQVCSLAKRMTRAEDGSRLGFVSRFFPACPMGSSTSLSCCGVGAVVLYLRRR